MLNVATVGNNSTPVANGMPVVVSKMAAIVKGVSAPRAVPPTVVVGENLPEKFSVSDEALTLPEAQYQQTKDGRGQAQSLHDLGSLRFAEFLTTSSRQPATSYRHF